MSRNRIAQQLTMTAGLLVMGLAPGPLQAQTSAPQTSQDQTPSTPAEVDGRHRGHNHDQMAGLNLTDDQKEQMKQIHRATQSQVDGVRNDSTLSVEQQQAKIHQIRHAARKQMVKMLTPDQRAQRKADRRTHRAARRENRHQPAEQQQAPAQPQTQQ